MSDKSMASTSSASTPERRWLGGRRSPWPFDEDEFFTRFGFGKAFTPKINLVENKKKIVVEAELPGMDKDEVQVSVEGDRIVIQGERHDENRVEEGDVVRSESRYGSFYRAIPMGFEVDPEAVDAKFKRGMLRLTVTRPKQEEPKGRNIPIG